MISMEVENKFVASFNLIKPCFSNKINARAKLLGSFGTATTAPSCNSFTFLIFLE